jgi:putative PIN family toxin of toxin-antitoxin system
MKKVVLDTNCLIASLSSKSENYQVWLSLQRGEFVLCVSNEILEEYHEVISRLTNSSIADNVLATLVESEYVEFVDPRFHLGLIEIDPDDNKFVDCAFAVNATYIVSNDHYFDVLSNIDFPKIMVLRLAEFLQTINN